MDEEHVQEVAFREVDLSKPYWGGSMWEEIGAKARGEIDLSQFAGQAIDSREQAEYIANFILEQQQAVGFLRDFMLMTIEHDPIQNIWIFTYFIWPIIPSMSFHAAVDGYTSELLRIWVI
jgi:hypothetical protein